MAREAALGAAVHRRSRAGWRHAGWRHAIGALALATTSTLIVSAATAAVGPTATAGLTPVETVRIGTADDRIVSGRDNQGAITECAYTDAPFEDWRWQERGSYPVAWDGDCGYWPQTRNFLSFDLSHVRPGSVTRATLVVRRYDTLDVLSPGATVTYRLSGVHTGARALARQSADPEAAFDDLGSGREYGTYTVPATAEPGDLLRLPLDRRAVRAINARAGGWFTVGGALVPPFDEDVYTLFADSSSAGIQRLVLRVRPEA